MDGTMRVWDVPAAQCLQVGCCTFTGMVFSHACLAMHVTSFSSVSSTLSCFNVLTDHMFHTPQVLRLGPFITSLSLSPSLDMLATTHINRLKKS